MKATTLVQTQLLFYYGHGETEALAGARQVVLQPGHHNAQEMRALQRAGTQTLAYLSLGEDTGPPAPWQRPGQNPDWGGHYVCASHPAWKDYLVNRAAGLLSVYDGLFLDTLDVVDLFPEDRPSLLGLVAELRDLSRGRYLMANRGFTLLPQLAPLVDGLLFEGFSCVWKPEGGYSALTPRDLVYNAQITHKLERTGLALYALDYADSVSLAAFARDRARAHGLVSVISNRNLTQLGNLDRAT